MRRLRPLRRATQALFVALLLLAPALDILRYDVAAKDLYVLGRVWDLGLGPEFYGDPSAFGPAYVAVRFFLHAVLPWLAVLSVFPILGFLLGRAFCGWGCPEGALFEIADYLTLKMFGRRSPFGPAPNDPAGMRGSPVLWGGLSVLYLLTVPPFFGIMLSGYFIAPARIWREVTTLSPSRGLLAGTIGVWAYIICKYLCGAGLMQMLLGWASPIALALRFDRARFERCTDCQACERACFMGVKPRSSRPNINCVLCAECVDACRKELGEDKGLLTIESKKGAGTPAK
jgi:polyferredoxin